MTLHPLADRARQSARPMPDPPPVTSAVLQAQSILTNVSISCDMLSYIFFHFSKSLQQDI